MCWKQGSKFRWFLNGLLLALLEHYPHGCDGVSSALGLKSKQKPFFKGSLTFQMQEAKGKLFWSLAVNNKLEGLKEKLPEESKSHNLLSRGGKADRVEAKRENRSSFSLFFFFF